MDVPRNTRVYRGTSDRLPELLTAYDDSCTRYDGTGTSVNLSADDPQGEAGRFYWYLVTGYNAAGEGPPGNATSGARVINTTGECE